MLKYSAADGLVSTQRFQPARKQVDRWKLLKCGRRKISFAGRFILAFRNSLICAFNQLLDLKDISTGVHSTRLAEWAIRVARKLNIPQGHMYQVEVAALLHDIGKVDVPDSTLKKQGPLKPESAP
jgi:HD-GYP domain-containing protein (c-di-GMP phosphodiesterase class II)